MQSATSSAIGPRQISLEELEKFEVPYGKHAIFDAYKKANFLDKRDETVIERVWRTHFHPLVTGAQKERKRPVTKEVTGIYRLKRGGKEWLMYHAMFRGTDWKRNPVEFSILMGRYDIPEFQYEWDPHTDEVIPEKTQVRGHHTYYDIEFTKDKAQELINMASEDHQPGLIIIDPTGRKYSCSVDEFLNDDYNRLVDRKSGFAAYMEERERKRK